jgi:regulator of replication initiation timing
MFDIPSHLKTKMDEMQAEINDLRQLVRLLKEQLDLVTSENARLKVKNQQLRDEIAVLKKQKPRPKIPPNTLEGPAGAGKGKVARGKHRRKKKTASLVIHNVVRLQPDNVPAGAISKGVQRFTVQDLVIKSNNTVYERERWQLPDGSYSIAELPKGIDGHYGPTIRAYVCHEHYGCRVTEPQLLRALHSFGVLISAGQLSRLLVEDKDGFHEEKEALLPAGIEATGQIQVDDIGARHQGKNAYTLVIGNALFAFFSTNYSKSRLNFLQALHGPESGYLLNEDAFAYIESQNPGSRLRAYLEPICSSEPLTYQAWVQFLKKNGISGAEQLRLASEAALFSSLLHHGIPRDLRIHADDAGQFAVFINSLCWIHEERHYRKMQVFNPETQLAIEKVRSDIWKLYKGLKAYKEAPSESEKQRLEKEFDAVFQQTTSSDLLNERLALTYEKKDRLLVVLDCPTTPLHNNATETDGRAGVVIKKISAGTRSDKGKKMRDTMLSLKQTARKLGINFWDYLCDRTSGRNEIPQLPSLIRMRGHQPAT